MSVWNGFADHFWAFWVALNRPIPTVPEWPAIEVLSTSTTDVKQQALVKSLLWAQCVDVLQGALLMPTAAKNSLLESLKRGTVKRPRAEEPIAPSLTDVVELLELWQGAFVEDQEEAEEEEATHQIRSSPSSTLLTRRNTVQEGSLTKLLSSTSGSIVRYWLVRLLEMSSEEAARLQSQLEEDREQTVWSDVSSTESATSQKAAIDVSSSSTLVPLRDLGRDSAPPIIAVISPNAPPTAAPGLKGTPPSGALSPLQAEEPTHHSSNSRGGVSSLPAAFAVTAPPPTPVERVIHRVAAVASPPPTTVPLHNKLAPASAASPVLPAAAAAGWPSVIPTDTALQLKLKDLLVPNSGRDPPPKGPLDPEHPQRVVECSAEKLSRRMLKFGNMNSYYADLKYDGERLIGFKAASGATPYKFYSRNMLEVPARKLGGVEALLDAALGPHQVVFDAEILSLHTFGTMNQVSKAEIMATGARIFLFDILWINGNLVMHRPLRERKQLLQLLVHETANVKCSQCYHLQGGVEACSGQLQTIFDDAMYGGLEGFVLKPTEAPYTSGGTHWVKLKRGYMDTSGRRGEHAVAGPTLAGVGTGPKIRRVDGVAATTVLQQGGLGLADLPKKEVRPIVDTVDCLAVGTVQKPDGSLLLLCAIFDGSLNQFVTCGCAKVDRYRTDFLVKRRMVPYRRQSLSYVRLGDAPPPLVSVFETPKECPVVEVRVEALSNRMDGTCTSRLIFGGEGEVVRCREDKDSRSVNSYRQLLTFFEASGKIGTGPTAASSTTTAPTTVIGSDIVTLSIQNAVQQLNDMHWQPLPSSGPAAAAGVTPYECETHKGPAALELVKSASAPLLQVLLVAVAPGRMWSDRGVMREVTKQFGPGPQILSDKRLALPSSSLGDLCALTVLDDTRRVSGSGGCVCCLAGVTVIAGGTARIEPSVLDIVLVRIVGMALSVAGIVASSVVLRIDVGSVAEEAAVRLSVCTLMAALPVSKRIRVILHTK